jgi:ribosome-binding protein aMBF1 (putative translation factor)
MTRKEKEEKEELARAVGENVRSARDAAGMTQAALSIKAEIDIPNISRIESGKHMPTLWTLNKLANALNVSLARLVQKPAKNKKK